MTDGLLPIALQAAVPMWIDELRRTTDTKTRLHMASESAQFIAEHGDNVLYRGPKRGDSAKAFNHVARGLAIGAFQPGGVTAFGSHWCTDHDACLAAESAAKAYVAQDIAA